MLDTNDLVGIILLLVQPCNFLSTWVNKTFKMEIFCVHYISVWFENSKFANSLVKFPIGFSCIYGRERFTLNTSIPRSYLI